MNLLVKMEFGSTIYGTKVPTSDTDYKAIFLPNSTEIILQKAPDTYHQNTKLGSVDKNKSDDVDFEAFSLQKYLDLLMQGQTVALDMLFTPEKHYLHTTPAWENIKTYKDKFLHSGTSSFAGYCQTQAAKYGIKGSRIGAVRQVLEILKLAEEKDRLSSLRESFLSFQNEHIDFVMCRGPNGEEVEHLEVCNRKMPWTVTIKHAIDVFQKIFDNYGERALLAESNQGIDWKALLHAVRVCKEAQELLLTGNITFPRPEAALLLQIRKGELPYKQVAELIEQGLVDLESAKLKTILPANPDRKFAEQLVYTHYKKVIQYGE